jgi:hypothetical protein
MFGFGQALNAGHRPSTDITSDPTKMDSLEPAQWTWYFRLTLLGLCGVDLGNVVIIFGSSSWVHPE